VTHI